MCCNDKILVNVTAYVIPGSVFVWCGVNRNRKYKHKSDETHILRSIAFFFFFANHVFYEIKWKSMV